MAQRSPTLPPDQPGGDVQAMGLHHPGPFGNHSLSQA